MADSSTSGGAGSQPPGGSPPRVVAKLSFEQLTCLQDYYGFYLDRSMPVPTYFVSDALGPVERATCYILEPGQRRYNTLGNGRRALEAAITSHTSRAGIA